MLSLVSCIAVSQWLFECGYHNDNSTCPFQVRQIRNRLSSSDWLFLNACLGIVNDDSSAVRAYLRQEGDRARQLTKEECLVLGQPSTFSAGGTLVHLAIR